METPVCFVSNVSLVDEVGLDFCLRLHSININLSIISEYKIWVQGAVDRQYNNCRYDVSNIRNRCPTEINTTHNGDRNPAAEICSHQPINLLLHF